MAVGEMNCVTPLILVSNPGSASRKYALYSGEECLLRIHFEHEVGKIVYSLQQNAQKIEHQNADLSHLTFAASKLPSIFNSRNLAGAGEQIKTVAIRIVAPSSFFQQDHLLDEEALNKLNELEPRASLHITTILQEINVIKSVYGEAAMIGISDSAYHRTMPERASSYALPADEAEKYEIKRYGYHGLSLEYVVGCLKKNAKLPSRLVVCWMRSAKVPWWPGS